MNPKEEECLESEPEMSEQSPPIPRPLEMSTVPAFLSKTFDIVDDALTDAVVSWGPTGASFVVWDPAEFSRLVLPRNFKHNNFSSFVRQLNTYGFRKVDADKWEFANKSFLRGNKHLLKNIQRRKSTQSQHMPIYFDPFSEEVMSLGLESEVERLREERTQMMKEVVELQNEQRGTASLVEGVKNRLHSAELRQKQMVSFFAKMIQNPSFIAKLKEKEGSRLLGSSRSRRRFLTQQQSTQGFSNNQVGEGASSGATENTLSKGKGIMVPQEGNTDLNLDPEFYVSVPDDLNQDRSFLELSPTSVESIMKQEGVWDMGLGSSPGLYEGGTEFSNTQVSYEVPDLGITSEILDIWDSGSLMVGGGSELDKWQAEISPFGDEPENEDSYCMPKSLRSLEVSL